MKLIAELLAEAVGTCTACDGSGWSVPPGSPGTKDTWNARWCIDCRGNGKMLTTEGSELVDFLVTWLNPKFAESDHGHSVY